MIHKLKMMLQSTLDRQTGRQGGRQVDREEKVLEKNSLVPCRKPLLLQ